MASIKKPPLTLDTLFFSTPEQKVMRFLLSEPTTSFTPRVLSSKLKGVRGMGGVEGMTQILSSLTELGLVDFVDNHRSIRLRDDAPVVQMLKTFGAVCDLENLKNLLEPASVKGILFGSRAEGQARSDSSYELFVVSESPEEVRKIVTRYPLAKQVELEVATPEQYDELRHSHSSLYNKIIDGILLWGSNW